MTIDDRAPRPTLDTALAALKDEEAPSRDLWPGILESISTEPHRARPQLPRWPFALAAGLLVAVSAGYVGWIGGRSTAPAVATTASVDKRDQSLRPATFAAPAGKGYLATRAELERTYNERLKLIAPATRARIEADLKVIRDANADIQAALQSDPQSPVLNRLMESIWQQEFDLYSTVARISDPSAQRTRT